MATRQADSEKLIKRIRAVEPLGWRVETTPDGYKCFDRRGGMWVVHMTYSDHRSLTNSIKDMENKGGLLADETEMRREKLRLRKQRILDDREAADRRAIAQASQQRDALVRAAGPYMAEIEECDLDWLTTEHPLPWMRWMYITPAAAAKILRDHNADNREVSPSTYEKYKLIILSGQWHLTHQGLAFDTRGMLQDGQHRCEGIIAAGEIDPDIKVPFAVFVGMPIENFKAIDEGRLRSAAQMLKKAGVAGGTHAVTLLRAVQAWGSPNPRGYSRKDKLTNYQAFDLLDQDQEGYGDALAMCQRGYRRTNITPGIMAAAYYLIMKANGRGNPYVEAFFKGLVNMRKGDTGLALPDDDPRQVLLNRFASQRPRNPIDGVIWVVLAWNNVAKGHHPRQMRIPEFTPEILTVKPGAGLVPRALEGEVDLTVLEGEPAR